MVVLRRIVIGLAVLLLVFVTAGFAALNNAAAMAWAARVFIGRPAQGVVVEELRFDSLTYAYPSSWSLGKVRLRMLVEKKAVVLTALRVDIQDALELVSGGGRARVSLAGGQGEYEHVKAGNISLQADLIRAAKNIIYHGEMTAASVVRDKVAVTSLKARFAGNARELAMTEIEHGFCGGRVEGTVRLEFGRAPRYEVNLSVRDIDPVELERALGGVFHELRGRMAGRLRLKGTGGRLDGLEMAWDMPSGGQVSAALLSSLSAYLPGSAEKSRVEALIRSGGKLAVEVFSFTMKNDAPDHLSGKFGLKSREANLELNISHEVTVDARIDALLQAWSALFTKERR